MATKRVTFELSDPVFQQLVRIAEATSQPLDIIQVNWDAVGHGAHSASSCRWQR